MTIITVSRGKFCGGQEIAECVAKKLGYRCVGREILTEAARQYAVSEEQLSKALDQPPTFMEHLYSVKKRYLACLRAALIRLSRDDNVVYHGQAGHFLLKGVPHTVKAKVVANTEFRLLTAIDRNHISREEALENIRRRDEERGRWTRFIYHTDRNDPGLYDIIINLDHVTLSGACEVLCNVAKVEEFKVTPASQRQLDDLRLKSHLEAIIANTQSIDGGEKVEIEADGGVVTIRGTVGSLADADRVRTIARRTPGVTDIISQMRVRLPSLTLAKISV